MRRDKQDKTIRRSNDVRPPVPDVYKMVPRSLTFTTGLSRNPLRPLAYCGVEIIGSMLAPVGEIEADEVPDDEPGGATLNWSCSEL